MKLLTKYNRVNILAAILVLLISSFCYYFILRFVLIHQLDDDLKIEEQEILTYAKTHDALPVESSYKDQRISFFDAAQSFVQRKFISHHIYNPYEKERELTRILVFPLTVNGKLYRVEVSKSQEGTEDLLQLIVIITISVVILLLLILFIVNRVLFNKLWQPFNQGLTALKKFSLSTVQNPQLQSSNIDEFNELNDSIMVMTGRVLKDYDSLKDFTENASHEIQTPLAIIKSKLELLLQMENLREEQMRNIQTIADAVNRLSKLNQSLLLLTKIENNQFSINQEVSFENIIKRSFDHYEELIAAKQLTIELSMEDPHPILMNETLAEILVSNLMTNAIRHNMENGSIKVVLTQRELVISNTGRSLHTNPTDFFERFKKDSLHADSLGLGLSIVKKITDLYKFDISYRYLQGMHTIAIRF